jgi:hypothetical protein
VTTPIRFDAPAFARAWLSVAQASGTDPEIPQLDRTVAIEHYPGSGVRLVATDRYMLLTAWIPELSAQVDAESSGEPALDEMPERTLVTKDSDVRGKGLLAYVHKLARRMAKEMECGVQDLPVGKIELRVTFDVRIPSDEGADVPLDGLEPCYVVLEIPDVESVYLDVIEMTYPDWRKIQHDKQPETTDTIALDLERVNDLAGLRQWNLGPIIWTFQGAESCAFVDVQGSDPHVSGLVMPVKWLSPEPQGDADAEAAA